MSEILLAFNDGLKFGRQDADEDFVRKYKNQVRELVDEELAKRSCKHFRLVDYNGAQLVTARFNSSGTDYAYRWNGSGQLAVGDAILVSPGYWMSRDSPMQVAVVTQLGTDYNGEISSVSRRAEKSVIA
jgi:YD repeat-containing protein